MLCLLDISCHVYADYAKILGINYYIDTIWGISEKIQIKPNRISLVFTLHRPGVFFNVSESEQSSMHSFPSLAMYTLGRMHNTDVNPYCLSLLFSHWIHLTTLFTVKRLLNIILMSNFLWILRLYLFCQGRKILRITSQIGEMQITVTYLQWDTL